MVRELQRLQFSRPCDFPGCHATTFVVDGVEFSFIDDRALWVPRCSAHRVVETLWGCIDPHLVDPFSVRERHLNGVWGR